MSEDENKIEKLQGMQLSPAAYVLLGLLGGCISAVILVTYITKANNLGKKKKSYRRGGPSSGSPLTGGFEDEKLV